MSCPLFTQYIIHLVTAKHGFYLEACPNQAHTETNGVDGGGGVNSKSAYSVMVSQALPSLELNGDSFEQVNSVWVLAAAVVVVVVVVVVLDTDTYAYLSY